MKNKILSLLLVSAMAVTMLTGCGGDTKKTDTKDNTEQDSSAGDADKEDTDKEDADGGSEGASGNPVTIKTVSMFGGTDPNAKAYQEINEELKKEFDYITIEDNSQTADQDWKATVTADFAVGNEPDVIQYFTDATATPVLEADKFVTLDEIKAEYPDYAGDIEDFALEATVNPDGVNRAVPTTGFWEGLFCNKKLFDDYSLEIPTDWDSLVKAIETFKENDIIPIAVSLNNEPHYWVEYLMLYASGVEDYEAVPESAPEGWVKGLETFKTLRDMGAFPVDTDTVDNAYATQLFVDQKAAMKLEGSWFAGNVEEPENCVVTAFPGVEGQKVDNKVLVSGISSGFYITKKAWNDPDKRDAAVKFVMAHTSKEGIEKYWNYTGQINVTAAKLEASDDLSLMSKTALELVNSADVKVAPTDSRLGLDPYTVVIKNISKISVGSAKAEDAINEMLELYKELNE